MRKVLLVVAVLTLVGCSQPSTPTSTTATTPPTAGSNATASTTTVLSTTTSTVITTTTVNLAEIDYPENPNTLDDLPDALTVFIGEPMPDPDLAIAGPEDLDRWMAGWLDWLAWINANPTEGASKLEVNMIAGSDQFEEMTSALEERAKSGRRLLGGGFLPRSLTGTFDQLFEDKTALRVVMIAAGPPSYLINDAGTVVSVFDGLDGEVTVAAVLRYEKERNEWVMETFEVLGRS